MSELLMKVEVKALKFQLPNMTVRNKKQHKEFLEPKFGLN